MDLVASIGCGISFDTALSALSFRGVTSSGMLDDRAKSAKILSVGAAATCSGSRMRSFGGVAVVRGGSVASTLGFGLGGNVAAILGASAIRTASPAMRADITALAASGIGGGAMNRGAAGLAERRGAGGSVATSRTLSASAGAVTVGSAAAGTISSATIGSTAAL